MAKIGLLFAMKKEVPGRITYKKTGRVEVYKLKYHTIGVIVSGVGQKNAANAAKKICEEFAPDYLISSGFCGGLTDNLDAGNFIIADKVCYESNEIVLNSRQAEDIEKFLTDKLINYRTGKFQTFDKGITSRKQVLDDVIAVDMESFSIAKAAGSYNIPLVIIRVISDIIPEKIILFPRLRLVFRFLMNYRSAQINLDKLFSLILS